MPIPSVRRCSLRKRIAVIFILLLVGVALLVYYGQRNVRQGDLYYSGTIEATQSHLAFRTGGRVLKVEAREGQSVVKDQLLAELDSAEWLSRVEQAKANLDRALKNRQQSEALLRLYEQTLPAEVERAGVGVRVLKSQLDEIRAGSRPQDIERARQAMQGAAAVMEDAKKNADRYQNLFARGIISERERDAVRLRYDTALREYERTRETLDLAREGSRAETIRTGEARVAEGEALLKQAGSNLTRIEVAKREAEATGALVAASRAALDQMTLQLGETQLKAPGAGVITSRSIEPGEVVTPGREVLTLSTLATVDLKIFVDETEIGKVKPGQKADVRIDTFPDKTFPGTVTFISPEGEFTPKIIQTRKERVKLVYLVKISLLNAQFELKPGMPADVWLR